MATNITTSNLRLCCSVALITADFKDDTEHTFVKNVIPNEFKDDYNNNMTGQIPYVKTKLKKDVAQLGHSKKK